MCQKTPQFSRGLSIGSLQAVNAPFPQHPPKCLNSDGCQHACQYTTCWSANCYSQLPFIRLCYCSTASNVRGTLCADSAVSRTRDWQSSATRVHLPLCQITPKHLTIEFIKACQQLMWLLLMRHFQQTAS